MKIAIVGAGPAGLYLGKLLSKQFDVRIFEEHMSVGYPEHCTGLVTEDVVKYSKENVVLNKIKGAHVHIGDETITLEKREIAAYVIDRSKFDYQFFEDVSDYVSLNSRVKHIEKVGNQYLIKAKDEFKTDMVIGADGPRSFVRDFVSKGNVRLINGIQFAIKDQNFLGDFVHIFLDRKYSEGFFSWIVPREDDILVGLGTYDNKPMERIKSLIKNNNIMNNMKSKMAGQIPIGILPKHFNERIYLTGDSAIFVKATSGGGLYYGLKGSELLANSILENKDYDVNLDPIMKELKLDLKIHKMFSKMDDKFLKKLIIKIKKSNMLETINEYGDIDKQSVVFKKMIFNKDIVSLFPELMFYFIKSFG